MGSGRHLCFGHFSGCGCEGPLRIAGVAESRVCSSREMKTGWGAPAWMSGVLLLLLVLCPSLCLGPLGGKGECLLGAPPGRAM